MTRRIANFVGLLAVAANLGGCAAMAGRPASPVNPNGPFLSLPKRQVHPAALVADKCEKLRTSHRRDWNRGHTRQLMGMAEEVASLGGNATDCFAGHWGPVFMFGKLHGTVLSDQMAMLDREPDIEPTNPTAFWATLGGGRYWSLYLPGHFDSPRYTDAGRKEVLKLVIEKHCRELVVRDRHRAHPEYISAKCSRLLDVVDGYQGPLYDR